MKFIATLSVLIFLQNPVCAEKETNKCFNLYNALMVLGVSTLLGVVLYENLNPAIPLTEAQKNKFEKILNQIETNEVNQLIKINPDDLKQKNKPTITLFPERHHKGKSTARRKDQKLAARRGKIVYGVEGVLYRQGKDEAGIEEDLTRVLGLLAKINEASYQIATNDKRKFGKVLLSLMQTDSGKKYLEDYLKKNKPSTMTELCQKFSLDIDEEALIKLYEENENRVVEHASDIKNFMDTFAASFLDDVEQKTKKGEVNLKINFEQFRQELDGVLKTGDIPYDPGSTISYVIHDLRNESMSRNSLKLYTDQAIKTGSNLEIRFGANHLPGMYQLLRNSLDATTSGKKVQIKIDESFLEDKGIHKTVYGAYLKQMVERLSKYENSKRVKR